MLDELEQMIGLAPVKEEVNKLLAGIEVERKRREQGLPMQTVSRHMMFSGPPGVGKTQIGGYARSYWLSSRLHYRTEINAVFYLFSIRPLSVALTYILQA